MNKWSPSWSETDSAFHIMPCSAVKIPVYKINHRCSAAHLFLALAFGPQLAWGFSGNLASFSNLDGGLASLRMAKEAEILGDGDRRRRVQ